MYVCTYMCIVVVGLATARTLLRHTFAENSREYNPMYLPIAIYIFMAYPHQPKFSKRVRSDWHRNVYSSCFIVKGGEDIISIGQEIWWNITSDRVWESIYFNLHTNSFRSPLLSFQIVCQQDCITILLICFIILNVSINLFLKSYFWISAKNP